jgi:Lon protease-like protein
METEIPDIVPILASNRHVFFPQTHLSLHIPRSFHDQMQHDLQAEERFLGLVLKQVSESGEVSFLPIGCVGRVVRFHEHPCGRAVHIDLHGLKRFRQKKGYSEDGYSQAWIEILQEPSGGLLPGKKRYLLDILKQLGHGEWASECAEEDDALFLNQLCAAADLTPMDKYFLLESETLNQRCSRFADLLRIKMEAIRFG